MRISLKRFGPASQWVALYAIGFAVARWMIPNHPDQAVLLLAGIVTFFSFALVAQTQTGRNGKRGIHWERRRLWPTLERRPGTLHKGHKLAADPLTPERLMETMQSALMREQGVLLVIDIDVAGETANGSEAPMTEATASVAGQAISSAVRDDDIVGRLDDTRFAVFLRAAKIKPSKLVARRIKENVVEAISRTSPGLSAEVAVNVGGVHAGQEGFQASLRDAINMLSSARLPGGGGIAISANRVVDK